MVKFIRNLDIGTSQTSSICALWGGVISGIMMFGIIADVTGRYIFNHPLQGLANAVIVTTPLLFSIGLGYTAVTHSHIRVGFFVSRLKHGSQWLINAVALVLNIVVIGLVVWLVAGDVLQSWSLREFEPGIIRIPVYPVKTFICFGFTLLCLRYVVDFLYHLNSRLISKRGDSNAA